MSTLLTVAQPHRFELMQGHSNDFSPPISKPRLSTPASRIDSPVKSTQILANGTATFDMSTPHRGLPPPSAMALPEPVRGPPPSLTHALGPMPAPPSQWQGQEDSMRNWLLAKAEEDKRRQEEEKTKQESYRLEQRRIEQSILREALQAGVSPQLIPMIYAGIGGSNLANLSLDLLQQYAMQLQTAQHQLSQFGPELSREGRLISQAPVPYPTARPSTPTHQSQAQPSQYHARSQPPGQPAPHQGTVLQPIDPGQQGSLPTTFSAYQPVGSRSMASTSRPPGYAELPRLTTNDMYVYQSPQQQGGPSHSHVSNAGHHSHHDQHTSSPSIYFHHWIPPHESKSTRPQTPAGKGETQPAHLSSQTSDPDYKDSPRKRKAQGAHQPAPAPSSSSHGSPAFSAISTTSARRFAQGRSRSNTTDTHSRSDSRRELEIIRETPRSVNTEAGPSAPAEETPRSSSRHSSSYP